MMKKISFLLFAFLLGASGAVAQSTQQKFSKSGSFFGATVKVDVCFEEEQAPQLQQAIDEIWGRFADLNSRLSLYDPHSEINKINSSFPDAVTVGTEAYQLIQRSLKYHQLSKGVFDITYYPLSKVWRESAKRNALPTPQELQEAKHAVGIDNVELLKDNQVRLLSPQTKVDVGSIVDGHAGDVAAEILRTYGFANFLIDTTGEIYAGGKNCEQRPWRIGVQDPRDKSKLIDELDIADASVTTSGNYEHYYEIKGTRWSHIINPITGYPSRNIVSATMIAPTTEVSDFWSTALCLLDADEGARLIDALGPGFASMVVVDAGDGKFVKKASRNYAQYSVK